MNQSPLRVLVVDDDKAVAEVLESLLVQAGYEVEVAHDGTDALRRASDGAIDAVLSDVRMPPPDGIELLRLLQARWPDVPVLMLTAFGTVSMAVEAMKLGAVDFILKPFERDELLLSLERALLARASSRNAPPSVNEGTFELIGISPAMRLVFEQIARAAMSNVPVLITGDTGTGKELAARAVHFGSPRASEAFVKVRCSGIPDDVLDEVLFGGERRGARGARAHKPGGIELAEAGTLFLDEIADTSPLAQARLLGLLESEDLLQTNHAGNSDNRTRIIASTQRDLPKLLREGHWREDLYHRLNVVSIHLPPLQARGDDAVHIAHALCSQLTQRQTRNVELDDGAAAALLKYSWPGNVRELANVIERLAVLSSNGRITEQAMRQQFVCGIASQAVSDLDFAQRRQSLERAELSDALARAAGNRARAARLLGISRRTLYSKLKTHGL